jgi:phosphatidylglycerol:prolipoprotein diacylglycerol transferase
VLAEISYDPLVRIDLGPLAVSPHGIFTAVGFLIGARLLLGDTRRRGIADDVMYAILTRAAIGAVIGARTVYVVNHWSDYESPVEWMRVWEGGISLLGGITGALVAATPLVRRHGQRFFPLMDLVAPWLPLGIAIGRIGDLVIADHLGEPTSSPLGFRCPDVVDVGRTVGSPCPPGEVVHLTAGYDLVIALVVAVVLIALRGRSLRSGTRTLLFGILYGAGRFTFDFMRADDRRWGLTGSQWTALAVVGIATALLLYRRRDPSLPLVVTAVPTVAELPKEAVSGTTPSNR